MRRQAFSQPSSMAAGSSLLALQLQGQTRFNKSKLPKGHVDMTKEQNQDQRPNHAVLEGRYLPKAGQTKAGKQITKRAQTFMNHREFLEKLPPRDLQHLPIEQGAKHTPDDLMEREKPNMPSRAPEPTVITSSSHPTRRRPDTPSTYRQLNVWFDGKLPLLAQFLENQKVEAKPINDTLKNQILAEFRNKTLIRIAQEMRTPLEDLQSKWDKTSDLFTEMPLVSAETTKLPSGEAVSRSMNLFDRNAFVGYLESLRPAVTNLVDQTHASQTTSVYDMLCRIAQSNRNAQLDALIDVATAQSNEAGHMVWSRFFGAVGAFEEELIDSDDSVKAMWELTKDTYPPELTPSLALMFSCVTRSAVHRQAAAESASASDPSAVVDNTVTPEKKRLHLEERNRTHQAISEASKVDHQDNHNTYVQDLKSPDSILEDVKHCTRDEIYAFLAEHVDAIISKPTMESAKVFADFKLVEQYQLIAAIVAAVDEIKATRAESMKTLIHLFKDPRTAKTAINQIASTSDELRRFVYDLLGVDNPSRSNIDLEQIFRNINWNDRYKDFAQEVLTNEQATIALRDRITAQAKASQVERYQKSSLMSLKTAEALKQIIQVEKNQMASIASRLAELKRQLLNNLNQHLVLRIVRAMGADLTPLEEISTKRDIQRRREPNVSPQLFSAIMHEVVRSNPKWLQVGVVPGRALEPATDGQQRQTILRPDDVNMDPSSVAAVQMLLHVFLRLTYVPHSAHALLGKRHKGRIGPIATESHQVNIDSEVGFAEHYDVEKYKQWDWQGWYQRMQDIFHRNVSIRCDLKDLRRLDRNGKPYIDLQTERRLRILAGDKVGRGILKLDSDRYEDQKDNLEYGQVMLQELMAESKKAQLSKEYWPTVEVKVRRPSGQSRMRYSTVDWNRVEEQSKKIFEQYREMKKTTVYVPPTATWLKVQGADVKTSANVQDDDGYTPSMLFDQMDEEQ